MIEFKKGDLFSQDAEALVNTVNCVGVMGRGVALQFKKKFSNNFKLYQAACKKKEVCPGKMFVVETNALCNPKYLINFPTKRDWREKSRMEDIESGLKDLLRVIQEKKIQSIALPPLGCGLGGLEWPKVRHRIEETFSVLSGVHIVVFEPNEDSSLRISGDNESKKMIPMTPGRAALLGLIYRYLEGLMDPFITLLEIHKLMYFLQEAGEQLKLEYKKAFYGPYAENLRHVLARMEGCYLSGYSDGEDAPYKEIDLLPGAHEKASQFLKNCPDTQKRFERVSDLVDGFESPFGLELLATIHWVIVKEEIKKKEDIVKQTYAWNERKRKFSVEQIELAIDVLQRKGWLEVSGSPVLS